MVLMKKSLGVAFFFLILAKNLALADNPLPLPEANVLPLELSDQFEFRKFDIFINAELRPRATPMTTRENGRILYFLLASEASSRSDLAFRVSTVQS